jgi:hypothetical protein
MQRKSCRADPHSIRKICTVETAASVPAGERSAVGEAAGRPPSRGCTRDLSDAGRAETSGTHWLAD